MIAAITAACQVVSSNHPKNLSTPINGFMLSLLFPQDASKFLDVLSGQVRPSDEVQQRGRGSAAQNTVPERLALLVDAVLHRHERGINVALAFAVLGQRALVDKAAQQGAHGREAPALGLVELLDDDAG